MSLGAPLTFSHGLQEFIDEEIGALLATKDFPSCGTTGLHHVELAYSNRDVGKNRFDRISLGVGAIDHHEPRAVSIVNDRLACHLELLRRNALNLRSESAI